MQFVLRGLLVIGLILPCSIQARPVSYPGGWTLMAMNNSDVNSLHVHYSPTARYSLGYKFEHWRDRDFDLHAVQFNSLLKRWNKPESQANLYFKAGVGVATGRGGERDEGTSAGGFAGFAMDWEDRRRFISYENRFTATGVSDAFFQQTARLGWAPYEGDYGDLHTWLMVQVDHAPTAEHTLTVTPLVRLFKGVHLVEGGINQRGDLLFNYVFRY
jgi:hypothetical protein